MKAYSYSCMNIRSMNQFYCLFKIEIKIKTEVHIESKRRTWFVLRIDLKTWLLTDTLRFKFCRIDGLYHTGQSNSTMLGGHEPSTDYKLIGDHYRVTAMRVVFIRILI